MTGYSFALMLNDGAPADPAMFATYIPGWRPGDSFLAGSQLQRFRILATESIEADELTKLLSGVWTVEPVEQ